MAGFKINRGMIKNMSIRLGIYACSSKTTWSLYRGTARAVSATANVLPRKWIGDYKAGEASFIAREAWYHVHSICRTSDILSEIGGRGIPNEEILHRVQTARSNAPDISMWKKTGMRANALYDLHDLITRPQFYDGLGEMGIAEEPAYIAFINKHMEAVRARKAS